MPTNRTSRRNRRTAHCFPARFEHIETDVHDISARERTLCNQRVGKGEYGIPDQWLTQAADRGQHKHHPSSVHKQLPCVLDIASEEHHIPDEIAAVKRGVC
jgi:hypothetical protein